MPRRTSLLALVLLIAGCGGPARSAAPDQVDAFPPTEQVRALRLPFDAYSPSLSALYAVSNAQDRLILECMKAAGQEWKVIQRPTNLEDLRNRRRYGVIEMKIADEYGYHVPTGLLTPADVEHKYDAREASLSESQKALAYAKDGCGSEAVRQLRPEAEGDQALLIKLDHESLAGSQRDPVVAAALRSWRECVRQQGFTYQDPFAAISDEQWWADDTAGPSPTEIAVAVADVRCKEQAGLIDAWQAAEVRLQEDMIAKNPDYFHKLSASLEHDLTAAQAVLAR